MYPSDFGERIMIDLEAIFGDDPIAPTVPLAVPLPPCEPAPVVIKAEVVGDELHLHCPTSEIAEAIEAGRVRIEELLAELTAEPPPGGKAGDWVLARDSKGRLIWERAGLEDWEAWWRRQDEDEMFAVTAPSFDTIASQDGLACDPENEDDGPLDVPPPPVQGQLPGFIGT